MELFPATTLATLTTQLTETIGANILIIVGVIGLAVAVGFVTRYFNKSTKKIRP